jgi:hypothetical protein
MVISFLKEMRADTTDQFNSDIRDWIYGRGYGRELCEGIENKVV